MVWLGCKWFLNKKIDTRTSGAPYGGPNGMARIVFGPLAEDLTWILSHFARGVTKFEPLGSILIGPSPKLPVRD